jgi:hypothetical protein
MAEAHSIPVIPVEIWQTILQHSLSAPDLFDPDYLVDQFPPLVINYRRWYTKDRYLEEERSLNALRRVCRSWNEFLRRYAHPFVSMEEVVHGNVPLQYLKSAIRILFEGHENSYCEKCKPGLFGIDSSRVPFLGFFRQILEREQPLPAKMLDFVWSMTEIYEEFPLSSIFPNLVHVRGSSRQITTVIEMIESLPSLRHMHIPLNWFEDRARSLKSTTLTTLDLAFSNHSVIFTDEIIQLPTLKHLHIDAIRCSGYLRPNEPIWLSLLKAVGKELRTLQLPWEEGEFSIITGEIWGLCPKLEDVSPWTTLWKAPPVLHPIHTIGVAADWITKESSLEDSIPDWPGLRTVRINTKWEFWMEYGLGPLTSSQMEWLGSRICLQDCMGETYTDHLSGVESRKSELYNFR